MLLWCYSDVTLMRDPGVRLTLPPPVATVYWLAPGSRSLRVSRATPGVRSSLPAPPSPRLTCCCSQRLHSAITSRPHLVSSLTPLTPSGQIIVQSSSSLHRLRSLSVSDSSSQLQIKWAGPVSAGPGQWTLTDSVTRLIGQICGKYLIFKIKILWISLNEIHEKFGPPDKTDIYIYT